MVPGEGPQPSLAMIVGEAPGFEEEKQGRPFVGRSGQLLDTALRAVGIDRTGCFVTNVVKEIPLSEEGKVRVPSLDEVLDWSEILHGEIEATAPACILALGRTASTTLCGFEMDSDPGEANVPFGSKVGKVWTAWHPAYVLRNRRSMDEWVRSQIMPWAEALNVAMFEAP